MAQSFGKTIAQAIDVAENEGWPIATAHRHAPLVSDQDLPAGSASTPVRH